LAGSDAAHGEAKQRFQAHAVLRRDKLTEEDYAAWSKLTLREPGVLVLDGSDELQRQVDELAERSAQNRITSQLRSRTWAEHLLRNLHYLWECPCVMVGTTVPPVPAFVVGAGPSLERNHRLLERVRENGLVIAVNSATKWVPAHVAVCIESNDIRHKLSLVEERRAFSLICDPELMACPGGQLLPLWNGELGGLIEQLTGVPRLVTSGSGTTAAVSLARRLGCSPIVLVGQDLAWTDGRVYAGTGSAHEADGRVRLDWGTLPDHRRADPLPTELDARTAPAWGGGGAEVLTSPPFLGVRDWLSRWADIHHDVRTYNCTQGGLHIPGWADVELRDVVSALPPVSSQLMASPPVPQHLVANWVRAQAELLRDSPEDSMLLDYYLAEQTITLLDEWRHRGRTDHLDQVEELFSELLRDGARALGAVLDSVSEGVAKESA
jgi:hypothetical protein